MLTLKLFSRLHVSDASATVTPRLRPRAQRLLAYLLLRRSEALGREAVAFTLWPDQPEADALGALRRALSDLRTGLPPAGAEEWVPATRDSLRWNTAAPYWLDVELFERGLAGGGLAARHEAVALYTGDLLADWDDDWVLAERERLRQRQAAALRQLVAYHRGLADYETALGFARQAVALDPLAEAGYRAIMALRYSAGDRAAALAEYERLRAVLLTELDVAPMPETQALAAAIAQGLALPAVDAPPVPLLAAGEALAALVGREDELARVSGLWESAAAGHGRFVIVGGPAGVGKTHLARHLAAYAAQRGGLALVGHSYEFERALPYQAIAEMLRAAPGLLRATDLPAAHRHSLARLLPEAFALGDLAPETQASTDEVRAQLYEALLQACLALARVQPLLLLFEDAHWAAESTLDWLTYAAPRLGGSRLLVAITYRTDAAHALARLGRRLAREGQVTTLTLYPLTREANRSLVAQLSGLGPAQAAPVADRLYHESAGNPFFLHELVRGLLEAGALNVNQGRWTGRLVDAPTEAALALPDTLRATLTARVERLSEPAQQFVRAAAVAGRVFAFEVVRAAGGWPEEQALAALEELLARGFATASAPAAAGHEYGFAHHLVQEVVYADLALPRRAYWHRRLAQALETLHPDDLEGLAYHFNHGGEAGQARTYYLRAGDRAARLAALEEAAAHYAAALASWPADDPAGRATTLHKRGECLWVAGELTAALEAFHAAHELFEAIGDLLRTSETLRLVGRVHWELQDRVSALRYYHRALALLEDQPESVALARAVSAISQMHMLGGNFEQALVWGQRALDLANRLNARDVRLHALNNMGAACAHLTGRDEQGLAWLRESLVQALALDLPHDASRAYLNLSESLRGLGRYAEAQETFDAVRAYATRMHTRKFAEAGLARGADLNWVCGRWARVLAVWADLQAIRTGPPGVWVLATLSQVDIDLGRAAAARDRLENTLDRILRSGEAQTIVPHLGQLLRACAALGDEPAALAVARRLLAQIDQEAFCDWGCPEPTLWAGRWLLEHPHLSTPAEREACVPRLERMRRQVETPEITHALAELRGVMALNAGRALEAVSHLEPVSAGWQALGCPTYQLPVLATLARAYSQAGNPAAANAAEQKAHGLLHALAAQIADPAVRETYYAAGLPARLQAAHSAGAVHDG